MQLAYAPTEPAADRITVSRPSHAAIQPIQIDQLHVAPAPSFTLQFDREAGLGEQQPPCLGIGARSELGDHLVQPLQLGAAHDLANNEDVKEFYLGMGGGERKSFKDVKSYKRRKRWLA